MAKKQPKAGKAKPSALGGPSTGAGVEFQVDFAVRQALELISRALVDPLGDWSISMEPRLINFSTGAETRWDIRTSPSTSVSEVKLKPTREEILEWLAAVRLAGDEDAGLRFRLFYGRGGGPLITAIERLTRLAHEAEADSAQFANLVNAEKIRDANEVLAKLGPDAAKKLQRIVLSSYSPDRLADDIGMWLRLIARDSDHGRLRELFAQRFLRGMKNRVTFRAADLIKAARLEGIELRVPEDFAPHGLDSIVAATVTILQACESGFPTEVIVESIPCSRDAFATVIVPHLTSESLRNESGRLWLTPLHSRIHHPNRDHLLHAALRRLLEFIDANSKTAVGWNQVHNAVVLAKECQSANPETVAGVFWKLDKLLKRTGDKRYVLEVANLSIDTAARGPGTELKRRGEAVALICGRSWVYQRIGRLPQARADAERSQKLGADIRWDRNTAYCLKCIGRLYRLEGEATAPGLERKEMFQSSIARLREAIDFFPTVTELPEAKRVEDVGDCYSLLARTFLVAGDRTGAHRMAREAIERIPEEPSKDFADLRVLLGDLQFSAGDVDGAVSFYDEAIESAGSGDAERSEIAARAWFQKGVVTRNKASLVKAGAICQDLEEDDRAAEAKWQIILLENGLDTSAIAFVENESPEIRVETARLHRDRLASLPGRFRGRRSELEDRYWQGLIADARHNVAVKHRDW